MNNPYTEKFPLWLKLAFTFIFLIAIPFNAINYSPIDLLWFCDVGIIIAFFGGWLESRMLLSMAALSSVATQLGWQVDYFFRLLTGNPLFGFTDYMFASDFHAVNYTVSLFHVFMPYMLLYSLRIIRYEPIALRNQAVLGSAVILCSFMLTTDMFGPAGNVNKVYGLFDTEPQTIMHPWLWVVSVMIFCAICIYMPTHFLFLRFFKRHDMSK